MVMKEADIGLILDSLSPTIQLRLVDCWCFMFMAMIEVHISLKTSTTIHITTVKYALSTQDYLKKVFQEL